MFLNVFLDETVEEPVKDVRKESNNIPSTVVERKNRNNKTNNMHLKRLNTLEEGVENAAFEGMFIICIMFCGN
jgi:hypothetical protein